MNQQPDSKGTIFEAMGRLDGNPDGLLFFASCSYVTVPELLALKPKALAALEPDDQGIVTIVDCKSGTNWGIFVPYGVDPEAVKQTLANQWSVPVYFQGMRFFSCDGATPIDDPHPAMPESQPV